MEIDVPTFVSSSDGLQNSATSANSNWPPEVAASSTDITNNKHSLTLPSTKTSPGISNGQISSNSPPTGQSSSSSPSPPATQSQLDHFEVHPPIEVSSHSTSPTLLKETTNLDPIMFPLSNGSLMEAITGSNLSDLHHNHQNPKEEGKKSRKKKSRDRESSKRSKSSNSKTITSPNTGDVSETIKLKKKKKKKSKSKDKEDGSKNSHLDKKDDKKKRKKRSKHGPKNSDEPNSCDFFQPSLLEAVVGTNNTKTAPAHVTFSNPSSLPPSNANTTNFEPNITSSSANHQGLPSSSFYSAQLPAPLPSLTTSNSSSSLPPLPPSTPISVLLAPPPKRIRIRRKRDPNAPPAKRGRPFGAKTHPAKLKRNQELIKQLQEQFKHRPLDSEGVEILPSTALINQLAASSTNLQLILPQSQGSLNSEPTSSKLTRSSTRSRGAETPKTENSQPKVDEKSKGKSKGRRKRGEKRKKSASSPVTRIIKSTPTKDDSLLDSVSNVVNDVSKSTSPLFSPPSTLTKPARKRTKTSLNSAETDKVSVIESKVEKVLASAESVLSTEKAKTSKNSSKNKCSEKITEKSTSSSENAPTPSTSTSTSQSPNKSCNISSNSLIASSKIPLAIKRTRFIGPVVRIVKTNANEIIAEEDENLPLSKKNKKKKKKDKKKELTSQKLPTSEPNEFTLPFEYSVYQRQTQLDGRGMVEESDQPGTTSSSSSGLLAVHQKLMAEMSNNNQGVNGPSNGNGWSCSLCGLPPDVERLGDLYGPYYVDLAVSPDVDFELMPPPPCKLAHAVGRKRSRILASRGHEITPQQYELWFHEDCIVWTPRVLLNPIGQLLFIEEVITEAKQTVCQVCRKPGATLSCFDKRCYFRSLHYPCAKQIGCYFDESRLSIFCEGHFDMLRLQSLGIVEGGSSGGRMMITAPLPQKILF